jgi:hypothetical protein
MEPQRLDLTCVESYYRFFDFYFKLLSGIVLQKVQFLLGNLRNSSAIQLTTKIIAFIYYRTKITDFNSQSMKFLYSM